MIPLLLCLAVFGVEPDQSVLMIPAGASSNAVRFSISIGDQSVKQTWSKFLEQWKSLFDTDADGQLSGTEAEAVPALINSSGTSIRLDVAAADTSGDGLVNHEELLNFYQSRGVDCINAVRVTVDRAAIQLGEILWDLLDVNGDGKLSLNELTTADQLLNRWDRNEDERLSPQELLIRSKSVEGQPLPAVDWSSQQMASANTISVPLRLNALNGPADQNSATELPSEFERLGKQRLRLRVPSTTIVVDFAEASVQRIATAQRYLLGEINSVRGDRLELDSAVIQSDPALNWLFPMIKPADIDRNNRLSETELTAIVNVLAEGASAQVSLTASIRGGNLFDLLDTNADNQLDFAELVSARKRLGAQNGKGTSAADEASLTRAEIPTSVTVRVQRGPIGGRFGRLRIAPRPNEATVTRTASTGLPRWFSAMDRNRDQTISRPEFIGPRQRFENLDQNADGVISIEESTAAAVD